jgi:hypothetical protein
MIRKHCHLQVKVGLICGREMKLYYAGNPERMDGLKNGRMDIQTSLYHNTYRLKTCYENINEGAKYGNMSVLGFRMVWLKIKMSIPRRHVEELNNNRTWIKFDKSNELSLKIKITSYSQLISILLFNWKSCFTTNTILLL